ncbi:hypothetical protein ACIO93_35260 [Streptomyces sp. NPDC087903]|uniref:hypothetical protein n=1 Tax=Streptomyces sp. NPDC087903 TaxID=3365819 RepID=UPI0037FBF31B
MNKGAEADGYYFALNGYQYRVRQDTVMKRGQLTGTVTVDVYKRYNWRNIGGGLGATSVWGPSSRCGRTTWPI